MRILIAILSFVASLCFAAENYVSDKLATPLRAGAGDQFSLIQEVLAGTPIVLLNSNSSTGYSKVRLDNGVEGYIPTRFLTKTLAEPVVAQLNNSDYLQLQQAKHEIEQLKQDNALLRQENTLLNEQLSSIADEITSHDDAHEVDLAKQSNNTFTKEIEELKTAYTNLNKQTTYKWFITGAAITFGGVFLGLFTARITGKRRSNWR